MDFSTSESCFLDKSSCHLLNCSKREETFSSDLIEFSFETFFKLNLFDGTKTCSLSLFLNVNLDAFVEIELSPFLFNKN